MNKTYYLAAIGAVLAEENFADVAPEMEHGAVKRIKIIIGNRQFFVEIRDDVVFVSPPDLIVLDHMAGFDHRLELADPLLFTKIIRYLRSES